MPRTIIMTNDGSPSIEWEDGITYHSMHGAIQESAHIFIGAGMHQHPVWKNDATSLKIFEMGLGTGLNALLTMIEAHRRRCPVFYLAVEAYPLDDALIPYLNYCDLLAEKPFQPLFQQLHHCRWDKPVQISPCFTFFKTRTPWNGELPGDRGARSGDITADRSFTPVDLVYYDAFDPGFQPELWTSAIFKKLAAQLAPGALFMTYCSKGSVRRSLLEAGFKVEKLPGPPGKREIVRAIW